MVGFTQLGFSHAGQVLKFLCVDLKQPNKDLMHSLVFEMFFRDYFERKAEERRVFLLEPPINKTVIIFIAVSRNI